MGTDTDQRTDQRLNLGRRATSAPNLVDQTTARLRQAIVRGEIRPNERLVEADLAEQLAVSRTPVRESLQRLSADGLIIPAKRGWLVREFTREEIGEIYEVRSALEGYAARLAAERASDEERAAIIAAAEAHAGPVEVDADDDFVQRNDAFHTVIAHAAGNHRLIRQIQRNNDYYYNIQLASAYSTEARAASREQHQRVAAAIAAGDADAAEATMRQHIADALATINQLRAR